MTEQNHPCPDCELPQRWMSRRDFLRATGVSAATAVAAGGLVRPAAAERPIEPGTAESAVKRLYDGLSEEQKKTVCFDWDHVDPDLGLLRTRVSANWRITEPAVKSGFFTSQQQTLIREVFEGIIQPDWHARFDKQIQDDVGGSFGTDQSIALFGTPGTGRFQFALTGRHMTVRCDGDSADHVAFGGPIFYGHAASGATEKRDHPGNVFWHQALAANKVFDMLDGKQQKQALTARAPRESAVEFHGDRGGFAGIPVSDLSIDQQEHVQKVLEKLIEPYRRCDREEVMACLNAQGGLDQCHLAFYKQPDLGNDGIWDNWRLEGPAFVWHFRGAPHVHVWVHVADDPSVELNA